MHHFIYLQFESRMKNHLPQSLIEDDTIFYRFLKGKFSILFLFHEFLRFFIRLKSC